MLGPRDKVEKRYAVKARMSVDHDWMHLGYTTQESYAFTLRHYRMSWRYVELELIR